MMRIKSKLLVAAFVLMASILMACGGSKVSNEFKVSSKLIKTEKVFADNFDERSEQGVLVEKVTNQDDFDEQWAVFGFSGKPAKVNWDKKAAIFLGIFESSTCPITFKHVHLNDIGDTLVFYLETKQNECNSDASPRTIVISVDAAKISDVKYVQVFNYHGIDPKLELP